jgi:hypothetical protein
MHDLLSKDIESGILAEEEMDPFYGSDFRNEYFGPNARGFFARIMEHHQINRHDEIAIITTSDNTYVSTCVTIPCFNYGKVSRVVTPNTKVVIVIHEYGYVKDDIEKTIASYREDGIVVVEDCAHVMGLDVGGRSVGSFGDYALFSLSKTIPAPCGGLLRTNESVGETAYGIDDEASIRTGAGYAHKYLSRYRWFNRKRTSLSDFFEGHYPVYQPSELKCPFFIGIETKSKKKIVAALDKKIEFGGTLRDDIVYIPTNPLVSEATFERMHEAIHDLCI